MHLTVLWGHIEITQCGVLGHKSVWHHNSRLGLSREEQYVANKKNYPDFESVKYTPPMGKLTIE